jgi:hypothetical protein
MLSPAIAAAAPAPDEGAAGILELEPRLRELERRLVERRWHAAAAAPGTAELLGISRNGLALKLERLRIQVSDLKPGRPFGGRRGHAYRLRRPAPRYIPRPSACRRRSLAAQSVHASGHGGGGPLRHL